MKTPPAAAAVPVIEKEKEIPPQVSISSNNAGTNKREESEKSESDEDVVEIPAKKSKVEGNKIYFLKKLISIKKIIFNFQNNSQLP